MLNKLRSTLAEILEPVLSELEIIRQRGSIGNVEKSARLFSPLRAPKIGFQTKSVSLEYEELNNKLTVDGVFIEPLVKRLKHQIRRLEDKQAGDGGQASSVELDFISSPIHLLDALMQRIYDDLKLRASMANSNSNDSASKEPQHLSILSMRNRLHLHNAVFYLMRYLETANDKASLVNSLVYQSPKLLSNLQTVLVSATSEVHTSPTIVFFLLLLLLLVATASAARICDTRERVCVCMRRVC